MKKIITVIPINSNPEDADNLLYRVLNSNCIYPETGSIIKGDGLEKLIQNNYSISFKPKK